MHSGLLERIKRRLAVVGLTEARAADEAGLSKDAVRNIRRDVAAGKNRSVNFRTVEKLARVLRTNTAWLLTGAGDENQLQASDIVSVPLVSWVSAGRMQAAEQVNDYDEVPRLSVADLPAGNWIALEVEGDSMDQIAPPGSRIFVNRADKTLIDGAYYVFQTEDGDATFKLYRSRPDRLEPFSSNRTHETIFPSSSIRVVGRVARVMMDL